jgi:DNA-binding GntR family transcriptional regulator
MIKVASVSTETVLFSKSEYAYRELKRLIIRGDLAPAAKLDLEVLSQTLGVSRMPIREALNRLQTQGLVEIHPQRSTQVARLSRTDMIDTYDARCALETLMADRALTRFTEADAQTLDAEIERQVELGKTGALDGLLASDRAFHFRLFEVAQAPRTMEILEGLRNVADRYIYLYISEPLLRGTSIDEHRAIVDHCRAGDADSLTAAVRAHVLGGKERLLELLPPAAEEPAARAVASIGASA